MVGSCRLEERLEISLFALRCWGGELWLEYRALKCMQQGQRHQLGMPELLSLQRCWFLFHSELRYFNDLSLLLHRLICRFRDMILHSLALMVYIFKLPQLKEATWKICSGINWWIWSLRGILPHSCGDITPRRWNLNHRQLFSINSRILPNLTVANVL